MGIRLTKRLKSGIAVIDREAFPEYAQETLIREMTAFSPWKTVVERLCRYEEGAEER